jgi:hypothetical protein
VIQIIAHPRDHSNNSNKNTIVLYMGAYTKAVNILEILHLLSISKFASIGKSLPGREILNS